MENDNFPSPTPVSATPFEKAERMTKRHLGIGIYRLVLILLVAAGVYLNTQYVSVKTYEADKQAEKVAETERIKEAKVQSERLNDRFASIERSVGEINTTLKIMATNNAILSDHEARIRAIENRAR